MAITSIIVVTPNNNTHTRFPDIPDDWEANQLVAALVTHFKLSGQGSNSAHSYKLVRVQGGYTLREHDTMKGIGAAENEMFVLLTEAEIREVQRDQLRFPSAVEIILNLAAGVFFIAFSFPDGLTKLGTALGWFWIRDLGVTAKSILASFFGASASAQIVSFNNLWLGVGVALSIYLVGLAVLSLRHRRFDLVSFGILAFVGGTLLFHLLVWAAYILIIVLLFIFIILGTVISFLFWGILWLLATIIGFLFGSGWWLSVLLLVGIGSYLTVKYRTRLFKPILWILGVSGAMYLLVILFQFLFPYLRQIWGAILQFMAPISAFIGRIWGVIVQFLFYLLIGLTVVYIVHGLGALLIDQFRGAWNSGNGRRGVIIGAFAIGISLALVLLSSNLGNIAAFFPDTLPRLIVDTIVQKNPPNFDATIMLLVTVTAIVGILRNLPRLHREPGFGGFQTLMAIGGPVIGVGLLVLQRQTED